MSDRHPAARAFNVIALAVGIVGLVVVVHQLGWIGIRRAVLGTGAWFAVIALVDVCGALCDAFAVHGFLRPIAPVSYGRVFAAQISGMAINRLTPASSLGEPLKVTLLVRGDVPIDAAVSSIVLFNLATVYIGIATIAIGVPVTALLLDLPADVARLVWIGLAILLAAAIVIAVLVRRGALASAIGALAALRIVSAARADRWRLKVASIDARLRAIADADASGIRRGLAGVLGSRCLNALGTVLVMYAADVPLTAPLVIASLSVGILITWMSNVVPLGFGLADGTNYVLYGLLGASPAAGLLFTMVNRLRTIVLALIGLAVMLVATRVYGSRGARLP